MLKAGHYTDLLRQVNELKRQLHLVEAERKACEDEGNEIVKRNQQRLNGLKQEVSDIKLELSSATRMNVAGGRPAGGRGGVMMMHQTTQLGILQVLQDNGIDASKYKLTKKAEYILSDLDDRIADMVKQADLARHQTRTVYQRIAEIEEELHANPPDPDIPSSGASISTSSKAVKPGVQSHLGQQSLKVMETESTQTEIQSVHQKMNEAYHIQRQYRTIMDVLVGERIGHDAQLMELERGISEAKFDAARLKEVREAARRAKDAARVELQHYEETLVASTRETDRLLSDYKRRIEEMKLSASPQQRQRSISSTVNLPVGGGLTPQSGKRDGAAVHPPSGEAVEGSTGDTSAPAGGERSTLHDAKRAIDHLKSVTGATDIRSTIHIVESQKEKCEELRQQYTVLQERQCYLASVRDSLHRRLIQMRDPLPTRTSEAAAARAMDGDQEATPLNEGDGTSRDVGDDQQVESGPLEEQLVVDYESALSPIAALITKICTQIPFGPPVDDEIINPTSVDAQRKPPLAQCHNVLNLLEGKLSALVEMVKTFNSRSDPLIANQPMDMIFSQVGQLSLPPSPRLHEAGQQQQGPPSEGASSPSERAAPIVAGASSTTRSVVTAVAGPKLRSAAESFSDEDQVPTRGFLKRQTRIIVEAKTKKQNQRPRKGGD